MLDKICECVVGVKYDFWLRWHKININQIFNFMSTFKNVRELNFRFIWYWLCMRCGREEETKRTRREFKSKWDKKPRRQMEPFSHVNFASQCTFKGQQKHSRQITYAYLAQEFPKCQTISLILRNGLNISRWGLTF